MGDDVPRLHTAEEPAGAGHPQGAADVFHAGGLRLSPFAMSHPIHQGFTSGDPRDVPQLPDGQARLNMPHRVPGLERLKDVRQFLQG